MRISDWSSDVCSSDLSQVLHRALRDLPGPDTGLRLGQQQTIGNFGLIGLAMMTARTCGDAVAVGLQYSPVSGSLMDLELTTRSRAPLRWWPSHARRTTRSCRSCARSCSPAR